MGPEIKFFSPDERDSFGQYQILPGNTHVFSFQVAMNGSVNIQLAHILPNSQDNSIVSWISEQPLDGQVLKVGFGHHRLSRRMTEFTIYDMFTEMRDDTRMFLIPLQTYYVNVKNTQNRTNAYELNIDEILPPPLPPLP